MAIEVNDWAVHPHHGVGRVVRWSQGSLAQDLSACITKSPSIPARSGCRWMDPPAVFAN
jgi:hypothetical protein